RDWSSDVCSSDLEFMSRYAPNHTNGFHANNEHLLALHPQVPQGISADLIATIEGFSREDVDRYAVESQRRTLVSIEEGRFRNALVPIYNEDGTLALDRDEHPRPGTTLESLEGLKPSFEAMGATHAEGYPKAFDEMARDRYP